MQALFDGHPELLVLPEESKARSWHAEADPVAALFESSRYGTRFPNAPNEREELEARLRETLDGPVDIAPALRALAGAIAAMRPVAGALAWVEKTPKHLRNVGELFSDFGPDTRVICMVRDPRAVYASRAKRWNRFGAHERRRFARRWAIDDALTEHFEAWPGFLVVHYEDLVREPEATLRRVASHVEVSFTPSLLIPSREGEPWQANSSFGSMGTGLSRSALHRYREALSPEEIAAIEALLVTRLRERGYQPDFPPPKIPSWSRLLVEFSSWRRLNRERRRPG